MRSSVLWNAPAEAADRETGDRGEHSGWTHQHEAPVSETYTIVIQEKNGPRRVETFQQSEVTIGRVAGNDIVLPKGNISKRHSRIVLKDGKFIIVDLRSTNGTYVNGQRIASPQVLKDVDKIYIGDFTLTLEGLGQDAGQLEPEPEPELAADPSSEEDDDPLASLGLEERREERPAGNGLDLLDEGLDDDSDDDDDEDDLFPDEPPKPQPKPAVRPAVKAAPPAERAPAADLDDELDDDLLDFPEPPAAKPEPARPKAAPREASPPKARAPEPKAKPRVASKAVPQLQPQLPSAAALQARAAVFSSVLKALAPQGLPAEDEATAQKATTTTERTLQAVAKKLTGTDTATWAEEIAAELTAFGPLEALLDDPDVGEIYVNGPYQVLALRRGELQVVPQFFSSEEAVALVARRLLAPSGVEFDAEHPIAETRLQDGTRVNAVHHAVAVRGPVLTIARSTQKTASLDELVQESVMSSAMAEFLSVCVQTRRNVLVCGSSGAGVGTLLYAMAMALPGDERIVTVEPVARLNLPQPHVVSLEPRPHQGRANHASMRDLLANALRMRPGRLICQDVSGAEALELVVAMAGGQDGTLLSTHAASVRDGLARLETMMLMAGRDLPSRVLREQVASGIDVVVMLTRFPDGSSRVTQIAEVAGAEVDVVTTHELFSFKREGANDDGSPQGRFTSSGAPPRFYEELQRRGEALDLSIFRGS